MKLLVALVLFLLASVAGCSAGNDKQSDQTNIPSQEEVFAAGPHKMTLVTADSLTEVAWFTPTTAREPAPLLIMLHMLGTDHTSFDPFIEAVRQFVDTSSSRPLMPNLLTFDLRGHGESTRKGDTSLSYTSMSNENFERIPEDVYEMTRQVIADYPDIIDTSRIIVIGASIGANSAMLLTQYMPYINEVVLISPGEDYRGLKPADAFKAFDGMTYILTGSEDAYSNHSSQAIARLKMENWLLKIYPTDKHGTEIIKSDPRPVQIVLEWIFWKKDEQSADSAQ